MKAPHVLASQVVIDHKTADINIDGVSLPWYLGEVPEVESHPVSPVITVVTMRLLVDGWVLIKGDGPTPRVFDPVFGDVGQHARRYVRAAFAERFPWLKLPQEAS